MKIATAKVWRLRRKLQALAERGVNGEKTAAQLKLSRLMLRFDFSKGEPMAPMDIFKGVFKPSFGEYRPVFTFGASECDVANAVKWAIEAATGIRCAHRNFDLVAEAAPEAARRLGKIAGQVAESFRALVAQFTAVPGVATGERSLFVRGLYDGMMNEAREAGQLLPSMLVHKEKKARKGANPGASLRVHPYTLALDLGRGIRFNASMADLAASLEHGVTGELKQ